MQFSTGLRNGLLNTDDFAVLLTGVASGSSAGSGSMFIYLYNGTVPANADAALNTSTTHTVLGKISSNAGGSTGTCLATAAGGVIAKNSSETWSTGAMVFSGVNSGSSSLVATFFRICYNTDNGQSSSTTNPRIQGTIGQVGAGVYDMYLTNATLTAGNNFTLAAFQVNTGNA